MKTVRQFSVAFRGALFALVVVVGAVAPVGAANASAGPETLTINHCVGAGHIGAWSASGAFTDSGSSSLLSRVVPGNSANTQSPILIPTIEFDGSAGTFVMTNQILFTPVSNGGWTFTGTWRISSGTGVYAGLQGQGMNTGSENADGSDFCTTYTGQVQLVGP